MLRKLFVLFALAVIFAAFPVKHQTPAQAAPALNAARVSCNPNGDGLASASFNWGPDSTAAQFWLDLSVFQNQFAGGTYISAGPFSAGTGSFAWSGLQPDLTHFARLRSVTANGASTSSNTVTFRPCGGPAVLYPATYDCVGNVANVNFTWTPMAPGGIQFLDLTVLDNGFQPGTFLSFGPLNAAADRQFWQRIQPNTQHFFRLNTLTDSGWVTSTTSTFSASCSNPDCSPTATSIVGTTSESQDKVVHGTFSFYYDHSTPAIYREDFEKGVDTMLSWMSSRLGRSITEPTCLEVRNIRLAGIAGLTYGHRFYIFTGDPVWADAGRAERSMVAMHELFHVLEEEGLRVPLPIAQRPWWMIEGAADFMAQRAAADNAMINPAIYDQVNRAVARGAPDLSALEGSPNGNITSNYLLANLAVQYLADKHSLQSVLHYFEQAGALEWHVAFRNAFDQTVEDFYGDFAGYRAGGFIRRPQ